MVIFHRVGVEFTRGHWWVVSAEVPSGSWLLPPPWFPDGNHLGAILPLVSLDQAEYLMTERGLWFFFMLILRVILKSFTVLFELYLKL